VTEKVKRESLQISGSLVGWLVLRKEAFLFLFLFLFSFGGHNDDTSITPLLKRRLLTAGSLIEGRGKVDDSLDLLAVGSGWAGGQIFLEGRNQAGEDTRDILRQPAVDLSSKSHQSSLNPNQLQMLNRMIGHIISVHSFE
jgi:hypothetical protein